MAAKSAEKKTTKKRKSAGAAAKAAPRRKTTAAKSARAKPAAAKKAPAKKTTAAKSVKAGAAARPAKKTAAAAKTKKQTATPAAAKKTAAKKTAARKPAAKKPAAPKPAAKTAAKKAAAKPETRKPAAKAKTAPKTKAGAKPAARPKPAKTAAKPSKSETKARKGPLQEIAKKMKVGQKPRGPKSDAAILPTAMRAAANGDAPPATAKVTPTSESKAAKQTFKVNDHIVYPAHGVGRIVAIEKQMIAGIANELFVIDFEQEKMKLRVPTAKAASVGRRALSDEKTIDKAIELLKGRARIKRTMWSRRAQEYEAKINSGDVMSVAEVVRDLYRAADQPEQSYSERQLFEAALDRLAREVAAVRKAGLDAAIGELEASLQQKKAA